MSNNTRGKTHFTDEPRFDHLSIKDVRDIRAGVADRIEKVEREFNYKGILIFRLKFKSNTTDVLVFGRNPDNEDQMIGLRVYDKKGLKDVAYAFKGLNMMALHACKKTLYCNALQLKWAFRDPNIDSDKNYSYIEEAIEQARVDYAKELLIKFREDDHDAIRRIIDSKANQLDESFPPRVPKRIKRPNRATNTLEQDSSAGAADQQSASADPSSPQNTASVTSPQNASPVTSSQNTATVTSPPYDPDWWLD